MKMQVGKAFSVSLTGQAFNLPSFELHPGEIVGVVGASRARIDLFLRLLAASLEADGGILPPLAGRVKSRTGTVDLKSLPIFVDGIQLYQDKEIHKKIGPIFSEADLNILGRTVLEDYFNALVAVGAPAEQQIATVALRPFGLSEKLYRRTAVLSGGEKQRLNCATALVGNRQFLVGDFTNATLDTDFQELMCATVKSFAQKDGTAILGGVYPDDLRCSRYLLLEEVDSIVTMREISSPDPYCMARETESRELKLALMERAIDDSPVLIANNVYRRRITHPLSLCVQRGEIVVLTGPNGVGKSTFGQILAGQVSKREVAGTVRLADGTRPVIAPQSPSEMILGLDLQSELPDAHLRGVCGLGDENDGNLDPRGFCHGTQKLLGVANALRLSRELAVLDEPTSGMDFEQKKRFVELLNSFRELGILIITHDRSIQNIGRVVELRG